MIRRARLALLDRFLPRTTNGGGELLTGPIRGELLGAEHLAERARTLAGEQHMEAAEASRPRAPLLLARLNESRKILTDIHSRLETYLKRGGKLAFWGVFTFTVFMIAREGMEAAVLLNALLLQVKSVPMCLTKMNTQWLKHKP